MKFSFIVPVYNVEKYLEECIDSLVNQSFSKEKYEIILVDDGSRDHSPEICDEYQAKFENVKVIHKQNGGLSDARNYGINHATGEYLLFIDSDDYLDSNYLLEAIDNIVQSKDVDLVVFGRKKYFEKTKKFGESIRLQNKKNRDKLIYPMLEQTFFRASACDKIIKRKIVLDNNLYFTVGMTGEDIEWCGKVLSKINLEHIEVYNENVYVYRQREGSISKNDNSVNMIKLIDMFESMIQTGDTENDYIVNSYLAYEYAVRLGKISTKKLADLDEKYKEKYFNMKSLLQYDVSRKVKIVKIVCRILGIKCTSKLLALFIELKKRRG